MSHKQRISVLLALFATFGLFAAALPLAAQPIPMHWTVGGVERNALVFAPAASTAGGKVPLVFVFHGHGGHVEGVSRNMAIQNSWPQALVVYMQGLPTSSPIDPRGRFPGWQREVGQSGDRDLKFFDAVLATLKQKYPVDEHRIYATGFSNGAFFTYVLWATRGATFAAFAPCAGLLGPSLHLTVPRPVLQIDGKNDRLVHLDDAVKTVESVRALNGTSAAGEPCGNGCTRYTSTKKTPVLFIVHPGGHVFPRWASDRIVEFFQAYPLG